MKQTLLLFCLALFLTTASGQAFTLQPPPTFSWVKTITFSNLNTNAEFFDFYTDPTGNSYVYGWVQGGLNFGPGFSLQTLNAYEAHFVAKYAQNGVLQWVRKIVAPNAGPIFEDYRIGGITADAAGNVYITSQTTNPALDFGNGVVLNRKCTGKCSDFFIAKYNADGIAQWVVNGTGNSGTFQTAGRMVTAADGSIFVGGDYNGPTIQLENTVFNNLSENGIYLARFSNAGNLLNANFYNNGNGYAQLEHLAATSQNKLLATGYYDAGTLEFGNGITLPTSGSNLATNYYVVEFDQQGLALWARNLNSESNNLNVFDIVADTFGHPYVVVDFEANLSSGPDEVAPPATSGLHDAILLHLID
ncbi:MAG: hypothetical protein ABIO24_05280, partial [Saprospiraceae bacterium]